MKSCFADLGMGEKLLMGWGLFGGLQFLDSVPERLQVCVGLIEGHFPVASHTHTHTHTISLSLLWANTH